MMKCTALHLAATECANCSGGACLGIDTRGTDQRLWFCSPLPRCLLKDSLPCAYFEECVLPLLALKPEYRGADTDYASLATGDPTAIKHPFCKHTSKYMTGTGTSERFCNCGAPLSHRQRYCAKCRVDRRRRGWRDAQQKGRRGVNS